MPTQNPNGALDSTTIEDFRSRMRGRVLEAGQGEYEEARRIQNGLIDRHPALIVRCSGTADVVETVNFARDRGLLLSIRGGGHNVAGNAMNDDLGGAMSRVASEATAYGRRDAPYLVTAEATWTDPAQNEPNIRWARSLVAGMRPFSRGGLYLNFAGFGEEKEAMLRDAYGANYDRLVALKTQYDPGNVFRMNLNIPPAGAAPSV